MCRVGPQGALGARLPFAVYQNVDERVLPIPRSSTLRLLTKGAMKEGEDV